MHLQQHLALELPLFHFGAETVHGDLDDVGGCALHRRVDGHALSCLPNANVGRLEFGHITAASQQGLDVAKLSPLLQRFVHVAADLRVARPVQLDELGGLGLRQSRIACQAVAAHPVEHTKVDGLGQAPGVGVHLLDGHSHDLGGGGGVDVLTRFERGDKALLLGHVGQQPQLYLRVVGGEEEAFFVKQLV